MVFDLNFYLLFVMLKKRTDEILRIRNKVFSQIQPDAKYGGQNSSKTFKVFWGRTTDKDVVKTKLEVSQTTFVEVGFFSNSIKIF